MRQGENGGIIVYIRQARVGDYRPIYRLVRQAFAQSCISDGQEQDWIIAQRGEPGYIPALELVAEHEGGLLGHVLLTKRVIMTASGSQTALYLAPLCVKQEVRGQGIGTALLAEAFARGVELGYGMVFLVGDPAYYARFGFRPIVEFGIQNSSCIPDAFVQAIELMPDAWYELRGKLHLSA